MKNTKTTGTINNKRLCTVMPRIIPKGKDNAVKHASFMTCDHSSIEKKSMLEPSIGFVIVSIPLRKSKVSCGN